MAGEVLRCICCGKWQFDVRRLLLAAPDVLLCDACIDLMHEILHADDGLDLTDEERFERAMQRNREKLAEIRALLANRRWRRRRRGNKEKGQPV